VPNPKRNRPSLVNQVRIIGGQYRRRLLAFPDAPGLRPTPDRVRETLFNWLGQDLPGWHCLDLFAGSGALGFEAASRGAATVIMVERERSACDTLLANRSLLGATAVEVQRADAVTWLAGNTRAFDLVFLDPPFDSQLVEPMLEQLRVHVNPGAYVYVEQGRYVTVPNGFIMHRSGRAGKSHYALLIRQDSA
jgi:16S rRNA (guanine966-N2)-methyltransferase